MVLILKNMIDVFYHLTYAKVRNILGKSKCFTQKCYLHIAKCILFTFLCIQKNVFTFFMCFVDIFCVFIERKGN